MDAQLMSNLLSQRKALRTEADAILDKARTENRRDLSESEDARIGTLIAEGKLIDIRMENALAASSARSSPPAPTPPAKVGKYGAAASWDDIAAAVNARNGSVPSNSSPVPAAAPPSASEKVGKYGAAASWDDIAAAVNARDGAPSP